MSPHGMRFDPTSAGTRDTKGALKRMAHMLKPERTRIATVAILTLIATITYVAAPKFLGDATNVIVEGVSSAHSEGASHIESHISGIDIIQLRTILLFVAGLYITAGITNFLAGLLVRSIVQNLGFKLREQAQKKIDRLPLSYLDKQARGDLLSRVTNDIDNINQTLTQTLNHVISSIYSLIGILSMMIWLSWSLALLSLVVLPLGLFFTIKLLRLAKPQFSRQWAKTGEVSSIVEESFTGLDVVTTFGLEDDFEQVFDKSNKELFESSFKGQFFSQLNMPLMGFTSNLQFVLIAVIGGFQVIAGTMTIGAIQAFIQYASDINRPISTLASVANLLQSGAASSERIFDFLDTKEMPSTSERSYQELIPADKRRGRIEFKNVHFGYDKDNPIIHDLSLTVEPGQQIAIVGPTGAGKTTLVNLLMRFYEIDSGHIYLDGVDIQEFSKDSLRDRIGMVLQDTWLFDGSIEDNIAFGRSGASHEDVVQAARATGIDRLIRQLPQGYDTHISDDDAGLSAGEKQLLTIARAYISQPDILILDEATSSVDTRTEMLVQQAMNDLRIGRTSFVIAHRLSTIRDADVIIVMEDGDVVEQGNHAQLMAVQGAYYRLYQSQFTHTAI